MNKTENIVEKSKEAIGFFDHLKDSFNTMWASWTFQNILTATVLLTLFYIFYRLRKRKHWQQAFKDVMSNKLALISFIILMIYGSIAVLDSFGYYNQKVDENGIVQLDNKTHKPLIDPNGCSILDWLLQDIKYPKEKSYSKPLATKSFIKTSGNDGRKYRPLKKPGKHLLGTDKIGNDCLYLGIKGIKTGIVIGAVTTLMILPFAIFFGLISGYFGGFIDDIIQFMIAVLSSIPSILLIVAFMLIFGQGLPQLCIVMGIRSWTGLSRILRAETLKIREMEYIQACEAMGISKYKIMAKHILPNVMHIILITSILGFSGRVMSEAVLTYIGIGVGADCISWGSMVNDAIGELSREPMVWWKLTTAFLFMFGLVLPANIFGDAIRDALDPRLRTQ